jgi:hypothetical protein
LSFFALELFKGFTQKLKILKCIFFNKTTHILIDLNETNTNL